MKSEQEIQDELQRAEEIRKQLQEHGKEEKAAVIHHFQRAVMWVIEDIDTTEVDVSESTVRRLNTAQKERQLPDDN